MAGENVVTLELTPLELKAIWVRLTGGNVMGSVALLDATESALKKVYQAELEVRGGSR
jgi:hypothetical protein